MSKQSHNNKNDSIPAGDPIRDLTLRALTISNGTGSGKIVF